MAVLTKRSQTPHLVGLRKDGVSYIFAGEHDLDLEQALEILNRELGIKHLLLEGGGVTNGSATTGDVRMRLRRPPSA